MKERPILFRGAMVRAILDGRKTQTRRGVKPKPDKTITDQPYWNIGGFRLPVWSKNPLRCPYGQPKDILWVRETWSQPFPDKKRVAYRADVNPIHHHRGKWRPSIFMPRWASRITLEITGVRVERVQEISEADARAEGVRASNIGEYEEMGARENFAKLWDSINGKKQGCSWADNPWVWAITFRKL